MGFNSVKGLNRISIRNILMSTSSMYKDWDPSKRAKWQEIYRQGFVRFFIWRGLLIYTTSIFVPLYFLTLSLVQRAEISQSVHASILNVFMLSVIGGFLFCLCMWFGTLFSYQKNAQINQERQ